MPKGNRIRKPSRLASHQLRPASIAFWPPLSHISAAASTPPASAGATPAARPNARPLPMGKRRGNPSRRTTAIAICSISAILTRLVAKTRLSSGARTRKACWRQGRRRRAAASMIAMLARRPGPACRRSHAQAVGGGGPDGRDRLIRRAQQDGAIPEKEKAQLPRPEPRGKEKCRTPTERNTVHFWQLPSPGPIRSQVTMYNDASENRKYLKRPAVQSWVPPPGDGQAMKLTRRYRRRRPDNRDAGVIAAGSRQL